MQNTVSYDKLVEKWAPVLDEESAGKITDSHRKAVTAAILENQEVALKEEGMIQESGPANNTTSELVRDLVMFDLFRLQPINPAAQTSFGLANPNARLFYMLKGFAIKQFDLMERRIIREWQQGNKVESLSNAMKYLVLSGGGYGVVNEGRQVIKGDVPNPEEAAIAAFYQVGSVFTFGAMGANEYGFDKFMEDPIHAVALNLMPPVGATLPASVLEDVSDAVTKGDLIPDETIEALPIVGKTIKGTGILDD